jgi:hypothetical protein
MDKILLNILYVVGFEVILILFLFILFLWDLKQMSSKINFMLTVVKDQVVDISENFEGVKQKILEILDMTDEILSIPNGVLKTANGFLGKTFLGYFMDKKSKPKSSVSPSEEEEGRSSQVNTKKDRGRQSDGYAHQNRVVNLKKTPLDIYKS